MMVQQACWNAACKIAAPCCPLPQGLPKAPCVWVPQVVLLFPRQFWSKDADMFGRVAETTADRGDFFLFYSYADLAGVLLETEVFF